MECESGVPRISLAPVPIQRGFEGLDRSYEYYVLGRENSIFSSE
jgi:hypothetical protein